MPTREEIREGIKEFVLEVRQYLCNTEFAPEPFTEPVNIDKLTKEFPRELMRRLDKLGVVIKVKDGESPFGFRLEPLIEESPDMLDECKCGHPLEEHDWGAYSKGEATCLVEECNCNNFELLIEEHNEQDTS